jgi:hypothetical protein
MLAAADMSIEAAERLFAPLGVSPAYICPTATGLKKSIMDATDGVREMLRRSGLHDFSDQGQGQEHKKILTLELHSETGVCQTKASLYRPETKSGDPRIWFSQLGSHAKAGNLIALLPMSGGLRAIIVSSQRVQAELANPDSPLYAIILSGSPRSRVGKAATQVIKSLQDVSGSGWLPAYRHGDTSVGMTLERALGIPPNPFGDPDYKGFEIKAKVLAVGTAAPEDAATRQTLFACVPDWDISAMGSSRAILIECGYPDRTGYARRRLYCEVSAKRPNSQGLKFNVDHEAGQLVEVRTSGKAEQEIARWRRESLEEKLRRKHAQTVWVYARERFVGGQRQFKYFHANLTAAPRAEAFLNLLESGVVSMDHLIKENMQGRVSEKGPLFKMHAREFDLLFPYRQSVPLDQIG